MSGLFADPTLRRIMHDRLLGPDLAAMDRVLAWFDAQQLAWTKRERTDVSWTLETRLDQLMARWRNGRTSSSELLCLLLDRLPSARREVLWAKLCEEGGTHLSNLTVLRAMKDVQVKAPATVYTCAAVLASELGGPWEATSTSSGEIHVHAGGVRWQLLAGGDRVWIDGVADTACEISGLIKMGQVVFSKVGLELCKAFSEKHQHVSRTTKNKDTEGRRP